MTPDEIQKMLPGLSRKSAEGLASLEAECKQMGGDLGDLVRYIDEAKAKGINGGSALVYAGTRLLDPKEEVSATDVEALRSLGELETQVGAKEAMDLFNAGLSVLTQGKRLGLNMEQTKEAFEHGVEMAHIAREHGLDPRVWFELMDEVENEGLTGDEADEAVMERFFARADRASWPTKEEG